MKLGDGARSLCCAGFGAVEVLKTPKMKGENRRKKLWASFRGSGGVPQIIVLSLGGATSADFLLKFGGRKKNVC